MKKQIKLILWNFGLWIGSVLVHELGHILLTYLSGGIVSKIEFGYDESFVPYIGIYHQGGIPLLYRIGGPLFSLIYLGLLSIHHFDKSIWGWLNFVLYFLFDLTISHSGDFTLIISLLGGL